MPAASVLSFTPDSVPPEKVPPIPVSDQEATEARKTYTAVAATLEGETAWLSRLRPANWDETALEVITYSKTQYDALVKQVRGRTGNPDAEYELELQWWGLWDRAYQAYKNPPSWLSQASDKVSLFLQDFSGGARQAWQEYSEWAIKNSGPVLRKYHDCLVHVSELQSNYQAAIASGDYSVGRLFDQEQGIVRAENSMQSVRSVYKALSAGGDIDKIAQEVYGPVSMGAVQIPVILAVKIVVIAAVIAIAAITVFNVGKLGGSFSEAASAVSTSVQNMAKDNPAGLLMVLGSIAAMIVLPIYLFRGSAQANITAPKPEAA